MPGEDRWRAVGMAALVGLMLSGGGARSDDAAPRPRLVRLAPGTTVDGAVPSGWTDRVIRSAPRLASGAVATLPDSARTSAALFRTAILAEVVKVGDGFALRRVGVGNAVPSRGRERVVTPDGPAEVRESLSLVERIVANAAYDELGRGRLAAGTATFALLRTPARLAIGGDHRAVDLYYAILIDPSTGVARTLNWATLPDTTAPPRRLTVLPMDCGFDCPIDVAVTARVGPLNVAWSFAMASLPTGRPVDVPPDLARLIASTAAGQGDPEALETALRARLDSARDR